MGNSEKLSTKREIRMRRKIKILQSRLRRQELKLKYVTKGVSLFKKKVNVLIN